MAVAGASRFLGAATLANTRGLAAQSPTLLGSTSTASLLEGGRRLAAGGFGISASARALNQQFLNRSSDVNSLFSLAAGTDATIESAQQQILALRAGLSDSQLSRDLRSEAQPSDGISESDRGTQIDQEV
jgi:hypothetical protein